MSLDGVCVDPIKAHVQHLNNDTLPTTLNSVCAEKSIILLDLMVLNYRNSILAQETLLLL